MAHQIPGESLTLNQDGSLSVQQRWSLAQSEINSFNPTPPSVPQGTYELEALSVSKIDAGMAEATATWRRPNPESNQGSSGNLRNVNVEIVAATREEPISNFNGEGDLDFASLTAAEVAACKKASESDNPATSIAALASNKQKNLAKYYVKGIEYFLSPSLTLRLSGRTNQVSVLNLGKAYINNNLPVPPSMRPLLPTGQKHEWLLTSITSRTAPSSDAREKLYFDVTEEYLLSGPAGWDLNLYPDGSGTIIDNA